MRRKAEQERKKQAAIEDGIADVRGGVEQKEVESEEKLKTDMRWVRIRNARAQRIRKRRRDEHIYDRKKNTRKNEKKNRTEAEETTGDT